MKKWKEEKKINKKTVKKFYKEFSHFKHFLSKQNNIDVFQRFCITNAPNLEYSLFYSLKVYKERPLFGTPIKNEKGIKFKFDWSYGKVLEYSLKLSHSLRILLEKLNIVGDKLVAISSFNRVEWMLCDFACLFNNYISVGVHLDWKIDSICEYFYQNNIKCLFFDSENVEKMMKVRDTCQKLYNFEIEYLICMDDIDNSSIIKFSSLLKCNVEDTINKSGINLNTPVIENENKPNLSLLNNIYTLIFSSGSTGKPKSIIKSCAVWKKDHIDECIFLTPYITASFSPLAHGLDRGMIWSTISNGGRVGKKKFYN